MFASYPHFYPWVCPSVPSNIDGHFLKDSHANRVGQLRKNLGITVHFRDGGGGDHQRFRHPALFWEPKLCFHGSANKKKLPTSSRSYSPRLGFSFFSNLRVLQHLSGVSFCLGRVPRISKSNMSFFLDKANFHQHSSWF